MPSYTLLNTNTDEQTEQFFRSYVDKDMFLEENPTYKQLLSTPGFVTQVGSTVSRTSGDFRDLLKKVKKESGKGDTINI
jgi:hypothetical protein